MDRAGPPHYPGVLPGESMAILQGALTVRRFRIVGSLPDDWRDRFRDKLEEHAFREDPTGGGKEEREGWVQIHNLLDTSFEDRDRWLYNDLILLALRVDKKALPAKLLKATLEKEQQRWCEENGRKRCPKEVREEIRDRIETAWLARALPKVSLTELCIHLKERYVIVHSLSDAAADRVRKRFFATFGLRMIPTSPLDAIEDAARRQDLLDSVALPMGDPHADAVNA
jgi:recombination associated protein RdgC